MSEPGADTVRQERPGKRWAGAIRRGLSAVAAQDPPAGSGYDVVVPEGYALVPEGFTLVPIPPSARGRPGGRLPARATAGARPAGTRVPGSQGGPRRDAAAAPPELTPQSRLYVTSTAITILAALLLTFALDAFLIGAVRHARSQSIGFSRLRADLANGTAPVNQTTDAGKPLDLGTPLGVIDIPWLGLREVFFEGTTSGVLQSGAGHRRDSPMPGQVGHSVIFGRKTGYGGPFGALDLLAVGSQFSITTGQGTSRWRVIALRRGGDPQPDPVAVGAARLTLVTATGPSLAPDGALRVDADLITGVDADGQPVQPFPAGPRLFTALQLAPSEKVLAGDVAAWRPILQLLLVLLPVSVTIGWARYAWGKWQAWVSGLPLLLAVGLALSDQVMRLLPNVM